MRECKVDGCDRPTGVRGTAHGLCKNHYYRFRKYGDPLAGEPTPTGFPENLLRRMRFMPDGCIEFTGATNGRGYGQVRKDGRLTYAHRASYELIRGEIPDGRQIDHLCRNRACVHPGHLETVTPQENLRRRDMAA